jgi:hypothetical protein
MNYLTITLTKNEETRILSKITINPVTKCWNWNAAKDSFGYGHVNIRGRIYRTHRLFYAWKIGDLPSAKYGKGVPILDHLCKNTSCCNPNHMELVSQSINLERGKGIGSINKRKTHCIHGHLLPEAREKYGKGKLGRRCIICRRRNSMRRYYTNKK